MLIEILKSIILGIVEGITEWLPISSTGHMIIVDEFVKLNVSERFLALFLVVIQIGAIMAVILLYFHKLNPFSKKKTTQERKNTWRLWGMVFVGCIPAAIIGILFDDWVNEHFYNAITVAAMLILYGIIFVVLERHNRNRGGAHTNIFKIKDVNQIDVKTALKIGFFQVLAIIPGTSRSGATIIGGMLSGVSRSASAEFTFFLAIPIMFGWGLVKAVKFILDGLVMSQTEIVVLIVGILVAFAVSVLSIKFLMSYIKKNDFSVFGWYRIAIGILLLVFFGATGHLTILQ